MTYLQWCKHGGWIPNSDEDMIRVYQSKGVSVLYSCITTELTKGIWRQSMQKHNVDGVSVAYETIGTGPSLVWSSGGPDTREAVR